MTDPTADLARLTAENRRLRTRIANLTRDRRQLRAILAARETDVVRVAVVGKAVDR
jgi:uncharacterized protein (DUF3084 family)